MRVDWGLIMASRILGFFVMMSVFGCQPAEVSQGQPAPVPAQAPAQVPVPTSPPAVAVPAEAPCEAALADPVALFKDRVLIRLPVGVEVKEVMPLLARSGEAEMVSACGAKVRHVSIGAAAAGQPSLALRDALFTEAYGLSPGGVRWTEEQAKGRGWAGSFTLPEVPGERVPIRGWFALKEKGELVVWALYEAHADDYPRLAATFQASGERLLVVPQ